MTKSLINIEEKDDFEKDLNSYINNNNVKKSKSAEKIENKEINKIKKTKKNFPNKRKTIELMKNWLIDFNNNKNLKSLLYSNLKKDTNKMNLKKGYKFEKILLNFFILSPSKKEYKISFIYNPEDKNYIENDIKKFLVPKIQKAKKHLIINNFSKINDLLFKENIFDKKYYFYTIRLNSGLEEIQYDKFNFKVLDLINPLKKYFFFILSIKDFFIKENEKKDFFDIIIYDKFYVFQSYYPFSEFYKNILEAYFFEIKKKRLEIFNSGVKNSKLDKNKLISISSHRLNDFSKNLTDKMLFDLEKIEIYNKYNLQINIEILKKNFETPKFNEINYSLSKYCFENTLKKIPLEDFLFLYLSIILEKSFIIISKNLNQISSFINTLISFLKPFDWVFPLIFKLPENCFDILNSPVPIIVGINMDSENFANNIFPLYTKNNNNLDSLIFVFLDDFFILSFFEDFGNYCIPDYKFFLPKLMRIYQKDFCNKKSNQFLIEKKTKKKNNYFFIKLKSIYDTKMRFNKIKNKKDINMNKSKSFNFFRKLENPFSKKKSEGKIDNISIQKNIFQFFNDFYKKTIIKPSKESFLLKKDLSLVDEEFLEHENDKVFFTNVRKTQFFSNFVQKEFHIKKKDSIF